jgi:hypothetical protein
VCNFPLGGEVVEKQDGIEELGKIFDADSRNQNIYLINFLNTIGKFCWEILMPK